MNGHKTYQSIHHQIQDNLPTCWIDYEEQFIIHVRAPLGKARSGFNPFWVYPCIYNNKQVVLINADRERLSTKHYGSWGVHYV